MLWVPWWYLHEELELEEVVECGVLCEPDWSLFWAVN